VRPKAGCHNALVESSFAAIFGPPSEPPVPIDWTAVEDWLGLTLPADYKAVALAYGPIDIGEYIWMHVPCVADGRFEYGDWLASTHRLCRIASREVPPHEPPAFHPAPGGLLAWGTTRRSDGLFWDTAASSDPDRWPIVVFHQDAVHRGVDPWHHYGTPLVQTLAAATRTGLALPDGGRFGPLPATVRRPAFLAEARQWMPPPAIPPDPLRRAAVTAGEGLETLTVLVPPPEAPHLGNGTWENLFRELGTRLPAEYVTLMNRYGGGCWSNWLRFVTPLHAGRHGFVDNVEETLSGYRSLRSQFPEYCPLPVWPEPGGFLPFANSIDGDDLGWLTEGEPDSWPLIVVPRHADQGPPLPGTLTDTLLQWARGRFGTDGLPALDESDDPLAFASFEPWTDEAST
jgi:hypothetical protein